MKIAKAIEYLNTAKEGFPIGDAEKYYKAIELGIEALDFIRRYREANPGISLTILEGETKE